MADPVAANLLSDEAIKRIVRAVLRDEARLQNPGGDDSDNTSSVWLPFTNKYAGTVPAYGLIAITGKTAIPNYPDVQLNGDRPSATWYAQFAVNSPLPVPQGGGGLCQVSGSALVAYDSGTPAIDEGWGFKPSQFTASKGFLGLRAVGVTDSTNKIMRALILPVIDFYGKATAAISADSMGTGNKYQIFVGTDNSQADGGWTTVDDVYNPGAAIANNDKVWLNYAGDALFIGKIC